MAHHLSIANLCVNYGSVRAVNSLALELSPGEIGCLIGPSGCGKTSVLRAIAGFEEVSAGEIVVGDRPVVSQTLSVPAEKRGLGFVFQSFALFPHLTVTENIGFGLSKREFDKMERDSRITEMIDLIELSGFEDKYPDELSGGQQQRVAIARSLAPSPDLILMDEPFSSLDAELRLKIAQEIRGLLKEQKATALIVTHDQNEAFAIADTVGVMSNGTLVQWDSPYRLYHKPANRFVASFVGEGSLLEATVNESGELVSPLGVHPAADLQAGDVYDVLFRPDDVRHNPKAELSLPIQRKRFRGAENYFDLALPDGQGLVSIAPSHVNPEPGERLNVEIDLKHLVLFKR